jgi:hypothetical protein
MNPRAGVVVTLACHGCCYLVELSLNLKIDNQLFKLKGIDSGGVVIMEIDHISVYVRHQLIEKK